MVTPRVTVGEAKRGKEGEGEKKGGWGEGAKKGGSNYTVFVAIGM